MSEPNQRLKSISIVIPIYCEEETIEIFYSRLKDVFTSLSSLYQYEFVFVNDGSKDRSLDILEELSRKDPSVKVISLSRNFGHQKAITAGIDHSYSDAVVVIDGDLQDPPEVIPQFIEKWEQGNKVVYGVRMLRKGETPFKLISAKLFYRLIHKLSDIPLAQDAGDFRLMDQAVVQALREIREDNRYIRGLVSWIGFSQIGVPYERDSRFAGETKFTLSRMIHFASDGITGFSEKPLVIATHIGSATTVLSFFAIIWLIGGRILFPEQVVQGWTSVMVAIFFLSGIQLVSIGILGEYIGRIYRETKDRPLYIIAKKVGYETNTAQLPNIIKQWKN